MKIRLLPAVIAMTGVLITPGVAQEAGGLPAPPDWFLAEIAMLTAGSGRWITDNARYLSDDEPYEQYGVEWQASFAGTSLSGRLFGLIGGRETPDFWEFRSYWHPGRGVVVVEQFGNGAALGVGTSWADGEVVVSDQEFWFPNGTINRTGHRSHFPDEATHVTESFDIVDGEWRPRRQYVWKRAPTATD